MNEQQKQLQAQLYQQRLLVEKLRAEAFQQTEVPQEVFDELEQAEAALVALEAQRVHNSDDGLVLSLERGGGPMMTLGAATTGLSAQVHLRMAQVPTAIYHLLDPTHYPLVSCTVANHSGETRRLRVTSSIEDFSAHSVTTFELEKGAEITFDQSPTLYRWRLNDLNELTRATLNVLVEDLDANNKVETHITYPLWLLARSTAPLAVRDPKEGNFQDFSPYLGAFVTPNAPDLMHFLRSAARRHPEGRLVGYQGDPGAVEPQVKALFEALKQEADITYVNSLISFTPEQGMANQRVRLPRESLKDSQANCIDGTVLFASLLEAVSLSPAIVIVPGHAFVAWETWKDAPGEWKYLETTMIGTHSFEEAHRAGQVNAARYQALAQKTGSPQIFRLLPMRELRADRGIMPME